MDSGPENRFIKKLELFAPLSDEQKHGLLEALGRPRLVAKQVDLVIEHRHTSSVHVILDGFACCYKFVGNGRRQIFSYLIPGDSCDLHTALLNRSDYSVSTLTDCLVAQIDRATILRLTDEHPAIARALWWSSLVDTAILREWITGLGQRPADRRIGHLFCELHARLAGVDLVSDGSFGFPISQIELGDTVGLSAVHVNRSLRSLREASLVTFRSGTVEMLDATRLRQMVGFDPRYLALHEVHGTFAATSK